MCVCVQKVILASLSPRCALYVLNSSSRFFFAARIRSSLLKMSARSSFIAAAFGSALCCNLAKICAAACTLSCLSRMIWNDTCRPARLTTIFAVFPASPDTNIWMSSASTGTPSIETISSPTCRSCSEGVPAATPEIRLPLSRSPREPGTVPLAPRSSSTSRSNRSMARASGCRARRVSAEAGSAQTHARRAHNGAPADGGQHSTSRVSARRATVEQPQRPALAPRLAAPHFFARPMSGSLVGEKRETQRAGRRGAAKASSATDAVAAAPWRAGRRGNRRALKRWTLDFQRIDPKKMFLYLVQNLTSWSDWVFLLCSLNFTTLGWGAIGIWRSRDSGRTALVRNHAAGNDGRSAGDATGVHGGPIHDGAR